MEEGKVYHIYNRGNNKENIFLSEDNYSYFLHKYKKYLTPYVDTLAYCLMPNHFHFLIKVKDYTQISEVLKTSEISHLSPVEKAFKDFFISYAKAFNKQNGRVGSLFQSKFKKKEIDKEDYFSAIIAYIHLNPVKAKLCKTSSDWKFSSYSSIISDKPSEIKKQDVIAWYGNIQDFIQFHIDYKEEFSFRDYLLDQE